MGRFNPFAKVDCSRGAPHGRVGATAKDYDGKSKLYARHCGGDGFYDRGGAYWGHSNIYAVWTRGGQHVWYVEAYNEDAAKRYVRTGFEAKVNSRT